MNIKIKLLTETSIMPKYATFGSAAVDLHANESLTIQPKEIAVVKTGISLEMGSDTEAQVRSRSGLAAKNGIFVINAPGTIDSDYRGDIGVILANFGTKPFEVKVGDRIAQMVFAKVLRTNLELSEELSETSRGHGGFGHTGV